MESKREMESSGLPCFYTVHLVDWFQIDRKSFELYAGVDAVFVKFHEGVTSQP